MKNTWLTYICIAMLAAFCFASPSFAGFPGDDGEPGEEDDPFAVTLADRDICNGDSTGCGQITTCMHTTPSGKESKTNNCKEVGTRSSVPKDATEGNRDRTCWCCSTFEEKQADGSYQTKTCVREGTTAPKKDDNGANKPDV